MIVNYRAPTQDVGHPFNISKLCAQRLLDDELLKTSGHILNLYVPNTQHGAGCGS